MPQKPIIETKNLNVIYFPGKPNQVDALIDINIKIYSGEFVIFFGPSGCGKSTLLYAIAGLERNIAGDILIEEKNLAKFTASEMEAHHQKKIGMIFQAFYLINSLSVIKNIILPQFSLGAKGKEREKRAKDLMERFGIALQQNKFPNELSGGQQQRVAVCRALINEPDIILADEPTGNLDSKTANDVMELLKQLNEKNGKTVILVTHSPVYLHYANRVFNMKDGRLLDIKINRPFGEYEATAPKITGIKDIEMLKRVYTSLTPETIGPLLLPFKSKELVSDVLTGLIAEEAASIAEKTEMLLGRGMLDPEEIFEYLDKNVADGGLGMDKRTALRLMDEIRDIVFEVKRIAGTEDRMRREEDPDFEKEAKEIREYLFGVFSINTANKDVFAVADKAVALRLQNEIDSQQLEHMLDLPLRAGGAGFDIRTAHKLARRLELLILCKFDPAKPPIIKKDSSPKPEILRGDLQLPQLEIIKKEMLKGIKAVDIKLFKKIVIFALAFLKRTVRHTKNRYIIAVESLYSIFRTIKIGVKIFLAHVVGTAKEAIISALAFLMKPPYFFIKKTGEALHAVCCRYKSLKSSIMKFMILLSAILRRDLSSCRDEIDAAKQRYFEHLENKKQKKYLRLIGKFKFRRKK